MGLLNIPLPFINAKRIKKSKNIYIPQAPVKKQGYAISKNTENEKAHFRFIKKHILKYNLTK